MACSTCFDTNSEVFSALSDKLCLLCLVKDDYAESAMRLLVVSALQVYSQGHSGHLPAEYRRRSRGMVELAPAQTQEGNQSAPKEWLQQSCKS